MVPVHLPIQLNELVHLKDPIILMMVFKTAKESTNNQLGNFLGCFFLKQLHTHPTATQSGICGKVLLLNCCHCRKKSITLTVSKAKYSLVELTCMPNLLKKN